MSPILFYGVPSGCSFGALVALEWLGRPYRLCRIAMPEGFTEAFRRINPVLETPALLTAEGAALSESVAILNHIAASGIDRGLGFAQGTRDFDRLNRMLAWLNTTFFNAFAPLWHLVDHALPEADEAALRGYGRDQVALAHAQLEAMLGEREWLLGDRRSLADAYFAGIARWTKYHDVVDRKDHPRVQRLFDRLQADPAVVFAHAIERGESPAGGGGFLGHVTLEQALGELRVEA
ncbi:glutathione S-transferase family protein [Luteimonas viscosa]|uniref:Glutathione S-transferase family protein n=1 Tax=Luteimonas viscosa TaxID=1132694 RepID=A0A5D4XNS5_9GAMM|nr:glutathione S-transferase family protein [Luteimonas viscosa]TYT25583.1 glutathione S-transferase family protein [Luteimonas viscosa]